MDVNEVNRLAALGEGLHLEFKRRIPRPERIVKELIAFANTEGGRLLVGVDDDGMVMGVRDAEEEAFALRQAMEQHCEPPLDYGLERVVVTPKREVIVVSVPESANKPHFLHDVVEERSVRTAYVRVGDMSVEASREAVRLMRSSARSENVLFEFGEKEQLLMRYLENYGQITVRQFAALANVPVRVASHTLVLLTRASLLRMHPNNGEDVFTLAYGA